MDRTAADDEEEPPPEEPVFPSDEEPVGEISDEAAIAIAGAGVAIFGMTIVDTVRQLDRREDLGLASQPTGDRSPFACNEGTGVDEPAVLSLPDGRVLESEIVDGRARFDVAGVRPGGIDGVATLTVGGRTEPVSLMAMQSYRDAVAHQSRYVAPPPPRPAFPGPCRWDAEVALQGVDEVVLAYDTEGRVVSSTAADAGGNPMWIRETEWDDGLIEAVRSAREPILAPAGSGLMDRDLLGPLAPAAAPDIDVEAVPEYDERGDIAAWAVNECGRRRCDDDDRLAFLFEHTGGRSRCTVAPGMDSCPVYREWVGADGVRAGTVRYRYDGRDRLVAATYADGRGHWSVGFESDDAGRVASASSSAGVAFTWERDASGNVTRMQATSSNGATMLAYTADYTCWDRAGVSP